MRADQSEGAELWGAEHNLTRIYDRDFNSWHKFWALEGRNVDEYLIEREPRWCDNFSLWRFSDEDDPAVFLAQPYDVTGSVLQEAIDYADEHGFELHVLDGSWWNPGASVMLAFVMPAYIRPGKTLVFSQSGKWLAPHFEEAM